MGPIVVFVAIGCTGGAGDQLAADPDPALPASPPTIGTCTGADAAYVLATSDRLLALNQSVVALTAVQEGPAADVAAVRAQTTQVAWHADTALALAPPPGLQPVRAILETALGSLVAANDLLLAVLQRGTPATEDERREYFQGMQAYQTGFAEAGLLLGEYCEIA
ncbi:MAG: hypothetical protein OXG38_01935 [Chloroflexi bacterium]|nr:hypothetical protein [Chloroflexota bacterium]